MARHRLFVSAVSRRLALSLREKRFFRLAISLAPLARLVDDELYQDRILDHYEEPFHRGHCPAATHAHEDENPLCGDVVRVELAIEPDGTIRDAYFDGDGCCISQASASMLIEQIDGKRVDDVKDFTAAGHAALVRRQADAQPPEVLPAGLARLAIGRLLARCGGRS